MPEGGITKALLWTYLAVIVILAVAPIGGGINRITVFSLRADYLVHMVLFVPWALLGLATKKQEPLWLGMGVLMAAGSESLQYLLTYRAYNVNDLLANMIGVAAGYVVFIPVLRRRVEGPQEA